MAPFETLFRAASASVRQTLAQATQRLCDPVDADDVEWAETAWGFYDSSNALREGLEVTEHAAPHGLAGMLQGSASGKAVLA
jgi:hypothetical protein